MVRGVGVDGIGTAGNVRLLYGNDEGVEQSTLLVKGKRWRCHKNDSIMHVPANGKQMI